MFGSRWNRRGKDPKGSSLFQIPGRPVLFPCLEFFLPGGTRGIRTLITSVKSREHSESATVPCIDRYANSEPGRPTEARNSPKETRAAAFRFLPSKVVRGGVEPATNDLSDRYAHRYITGPNAAPRCRVAAKSGGWDSNPRSRVPETRGLTAALHPE